MKPMGAELAGIPVLLVDDNKDVLIVFGAYLTRLTIPPSHCCA